MAKNKLVPLTHTQIHHIYHKLGESKNARKIKAKLRIAMNTTCVKTTKSLSKELQEELASLENDYKEEFNAVEDLRCIVEAKDEKIKKLTEALEGVSKWLSTRDSDVTTGFDTAKLDELLAEIKGES